METHKTRFEYYCLLDIRQMVNKSNANMKIILSLICVLKSCISWLLVIWVMQCKNRISKCKCQYLCWLNSIKNIKTIHIQQVLMRSKSNRIFRWYFFFRPTYYIHFPGKILLIKTKNLLTAIKKWCRCPLLDIWFHRVYYPKKLQQHPCPMPILYFVDFTSILYFINQKASVLISINRNSQLLWD